MVYKSFSLSKKDQFLPVKVIVGAFDGSEVVGSNVVGSNVVGSNVVGFNVVGSNVVGSNVVGFNVVGFNVVGFNVVGSNVVGSNVVVLVGEVEGTEVGLSEGSSVVGLVGEMDGLSVSDIGDRVGAKVPISFLIAWSVVLQIVMRLSSIKGDVFASILIPVSGPTQQFGIFNTNEQKQDP